MALYLCEILALFYIIIVLFQAKRRGSCQIRFVFLKPVLNRCNKSLVLHSSLHSFMSSFIRCMCFRNFVEIFSCLTLSQLVVNRILVYLLFTCAIRVSATPLKKEVTAFVFLIRCDVFAISSICFSCKRNIFATCPKQNSSEFTIYFYN